MLRNQRGFAFYPRKKDVIVHSPSNKIDSFEKKDSRFEKYT